MMQSKFYKPSFLFCVVCWCFTFLTSSQVFSNEDSYLKISPNNSKIYVNSTDVVINQYGIYFFSDGECFKANSLIRDENGLSVVAAPMYWTCKEGHINPLYVYPCRICGKGLPGT